MFNYDGLNICFSADVYEPDEDTFLLLKSITAKKGDEVLEIGAGTGIVSLFLARIAKHVTGVDISPVAVELAQKNAKLNGITNVRFFESDLFEKVEGKYDIILFNPPYVPTEEEDKSVLALAWDGGPGGRKVTDRFLTEAPARLKDGGSIFILDSSLSGHQKTIEFFRKNGFDARIIAEKKLFFEVLYVICAKRIS